MEANQNVYKFGVVIPAVMYLVASIITFEGNRSPTLLTLLIYGLPVIGFLFSVKCMLASEIFSGKVAYGAFALVYIFLLAVSIYINM